MCIPFTLLFVLRKCHEYVRKIVRIEHNRQPFLGCGAQQKWIWSLMSRDLWLLWLRMLYSSNSYMRLLYNFCNASLCSLNFSISIKTDKTECGPAFVMFSCFHASGMNQLIEIGASIVRHLVPIPRKLRKTSWWKSICDVLGNTARLFWSTLFNWLFDNLLGLFDECCLGNFKLIISPSGLNYCVIEFKFLVTLNVMNTLSFVGMIIQ